MQAKVRSGDLQMFRHATRPGVVGLLVPVVGFIRVRRGKAPGGNGTQVDRWREGHSPAGGWSAERCGQVKVADQLQASDK